MKLCRIGELGKEKPAIIDKDGSYKDLSSVISDLNPENLNFETLDKIKRLNTKDLPTLKANSRIGACVNNPSKFLGIIDDSHIAPLRLSYEIISFWFLVIFTTQFLNLI